MTSCVMFHLAFIDKCVNERETNCFNIANLYYFFGVKMNEIEIVHSWVKLETINVFYPLGVDWHNAD